jgi:polyhydroxyalkanoate synthesis repressor PhaR
MPVIKRYPNRKLYDTSAKQYITLEDVATLVRRGQNVTVVDHASGEDLTALTLSQVIYEQAKRHSGFLPRPVLRELIRAGGETVVALRRALADPLDLLRQVDEEIQRRIDALVAAGELEDQEAQVWRQKLQAVSPRWPAPVGPGLDERDLERALRTQDLPTRKDWQQLVAQLDALAAKLDDIRDDLDT